MTSQIDNATAHYIGILEAVVAVLAIKSGMHPEVMMANAITDITKIAGMETEESDLLIQSRWTNRNVNAGVMAARAVSVDDIRGNRSLENESIPATTTEAVSMAQRARQYRNSHPR